MPFPLELRWVHAAEHHLGRRLPHGYVARMCRYNGGSIQVIGDSFDLFPILDASDRRRLKRSTNHIIDETKRMTGFPGFPAGALAIAENGTGDLLVFLPDDQPLVAGGLPRFADAIYRWDYHSGELARVAECLEDLT